MEKKGNLRLFAPSGVPKKERLTELPPKKKKKETPKKKPKRGKITAEICDISREKRGSRRPRKTIGFGGPGQVLGGKKYSRVF